MEKKGGQGKAKEKKWESGRETHVKFLLETKRGSVEKRNQEAETRSKK